MSMKNGLWLYAFVLVMSAMGCDCNPKKIDSQYGVMSVIWTDIDGVEQFDRSATYNFGKALIGQKNSLALRVKNEGTRSLSLAKLERTMTPGDDAAITPGMPNEQAPFEVQFSRTENIEPGATVEFTMFFAPKALRANYSTELKLSAEGTRNEDSTATITLLGGGEGGDCSIPLVIDFGNVPTGETFTYPIDLNNPASVDATASVGDLAGPDATSFGFAADSARGSPLNVPKMSTKTVKVTFSPTEKRQYSATLELQGVGECPKRTVTVRGTGSDDVLSWTPTELPFGFVNPGDDAFREVTFRNPSGAPVTLTAVTSTNPANFYHAVPAGADATKFTVNGGGETKMKLACSPTTLGPREANLTFNTGITRRPMGTIHLTCTGGGPRIRVSPRPNLAFGRVGFFPGSSSFNVSRKVTIQNVGSRPPNLADGGVDTSANLRLGKVDPIDSTPGNMPYFELEPGTGLDPSEISVSFATAYIGATGLVATPGNFVDLSVVLTPASAGMKTGKLKIYSNDGLDPTVELNITADVQQLPPCNYRVSPTMANFGLVTPGTSKDLPITITNLGTNSNDVCYLSAIDLRAGSNPAYSIVGGPVVEKELQPSESWNVVVRVTPPGPVPMVTTTLQGELQFNVTSPTNPQGRVQLTTSMGPSCLVVTPDPLDFGLVKTSCNSPAKTLNLYNSCASPVYLKTIVMQSAAGQPTGGPNCTNPMGCPEFKLVQTPQIPAPPSSGLSIAPGAAPVTIQVRYSPIDVGNDSGALALGVVQSGQDVTYLVTLAGHSDTTGIQTETFVQDLRPKADVLLVVDDSGSMGDKQMNLSQNFNSFIQFAVAANVDYQIGVTTTTEVQSEQVCNPITGCITAANQSVAWGGKMRRIAATATAPAIGPILKPTTPNVNQAFRTLVNVGTNGSGGEQALQCAVLALTPPVIAAENAGFVRPDANLAIVVVSDASDQSTQPVSYYQNRLINVKGFNRLSQFTFNVIGPYMSNNTSTSCPYDDMNSSAYPRLDNVVQATGGVHEEICNTNWAAALQRLGRTAFGARTQFFLNNFPDTMGMPINVSINGQPRMMGVDWTYDSAANSINFTRNPPMGGDMLTIVYPIACL